MKPASVRVFLHKISSTLWFFLEFVNPKLVHAMCKVLYESEITVRELLSSLPPPQEPQGCG